MSDDRINKILDYLTTRITKIEEFAVEQIPDVIQQIVTMDLVVSMFTAIVLLGVIVLGWIIIIVVWQLTKKLKMEAKWVPRIILTIAMIGGTIPALIFSLQNWSIVVKANYAPKAYLLERVGVLKPLGDHK